MDQIKFPEAIQRSGDRRLRYVKFCSEPPNSLRFVFHVTCQEHTQLTN
jgi:hypothetical protein